MEVYLTAKEEPYRMFSTDKNEYLRRGPWSRMMQNLNDPVFLCFSHLRLCTFGSLCIHLAPFFERWRVAKPDKASSKGPPGKCKQANSNDQSFICQRDGRVALTRGGRWHRFFDSVDLNVCLVFCLNMWVSFVVIFVTCLICSF